jgi:hypothetical protein
MEFVMFKKMFLLLIIVSTLVSCYTQKVYLDANKKSGKMVIDYNLDNDYLSVLSTALANFQTTGKNQQTIDPNALIDEKLFRETFKNNKDVTLKSVKITATKGYTGHIEITFTDFEKALKLLPEGVINIAVLRDGNNVTITQVINISKMDKDGIFIDFLNQQKEDDINLYNKLTKTAFFKFETYTATQIKKTEGITLSNDKMKADYSFRLNELLQNKDKDMKFLISF